MSVAATIEELRAKVRSGRRILPVGAGTKPGLSGPDAGACELLDVSALSGVTEYEPDELTLTALAGTPISEIEGVLAEHGQYMPFDPPLAAAGATLGGTVAAGISGPGAWRYGSLRDFVIGVKLIDGTGTLVGGGGKVVKNAAGFDLPKTMVGSIGRLGVIIEVSIKVFPRPRETTTLSFRFPELGDAMAAIARIGRGPIAAEAVEVIPPGRLIVRLGADPELLSTLARRLEEVVGAEADRDFDAIAFWQQTAELSPAEGEGALLRGAVTPGKVVDLEKQLGDAGTLRRLSNGANIAWISLPDEALTGEVDARLSQLGIPAMTVFGPPGNPLIGARPGGAFADRIKAAIDPCSRFLEV